MLNMIPKMQRHYCRSLTPELMQMKVFDLSLSHMHEVYKWWCEETKVPAAQRKAFSEVIHANKISIFKLRKDQCDMFLSKKATVQKKNITYT
jgi:hypothetical protein